MELSSIAEAMADFATKRGKQPTHIYVDVPFLKEWGEYVFENSNMQLQLATILGMKIVICDELPLQRKGFFVTA